MPITGGIKFFERNKAMFVDGASANASSGNDLVKFILAQNVYRSWSSSGSSDSSTETITINLQNTKTINRLVLVDHNFKNYSITYNSGNQFNNVFNVKEETSSLIAEANYDLDTSYYEFDSVSVNTIEITINTTQVANAEKTLNQILLTTEIGTFQGYPTVNRNQFSRNERTVKTENGLNFITKRERTNSGISLRFDAYPIPEDVDIVHELFDLEESFLVWPCGGGRSPEYFKHEQRGWRLKDIFNMQTKGNLQALFYQNLYKSGLKTSINFVPSL